MSGKHYTREELVRIEAMAKRGLGAVAIAKKLGSRSAGGIQGQLQKLGFIDPDRSQSAKSRRKRQMNTQQHRQFCDFLRDNIQRAPPIELMRFWNEQCSRFRLPAVTIDMVDYWVDKMRIRLPVEEARNNPYYLLAKRDRYGRRSETARATIERKADARRATLRQRAREVLRKNAKIPCKQCPDCCQIWPMTEEFYRAKRDSHSGKLYFEARGCILCVNRVRRQVTQWRAMGKSATLIRQLLKAEERRRRNARAQEAVVNARRMRDELVKSKKKLVCRQCLECKEDWPLTPSFWRPAGKGTFPRFCRFCDSRYRREQKRAVVDGRSVEALRASRRVLLEFSLIASRKARRAELQELANSKFHRSLATRSRVCSICHTQWPLSEEFWIFERDDGPRAGKLARVYCRSCSHEKDAQRNKLRRR